MLRKEIKKMTKQEKLIVSAYTGFLMTNFDDFHEYVEKLLNRPVFTHEFGLDIIINEIKAKSKADFLKLCKEE